jgi:hypothetical protein
MTRIVRSTHRYKPRKKRSVPLTGPATPKRRRTRAVLSFVGLALNTGTGQAQTDAEILEVTRQCVALVQQTFPRFDAYFDLTEEQWRTFQSDDSAFYFRRCLIERGLAPE